MSKRAFIVAFVLGDRLSSSILIYVSCMNSILSEQSVRISSIDEIKKGDVLITLIEIMWPKAELSKNMKDRDEEASPENKVKAVLTYLTSIGVKHTLTHEAIVEGELKSTLEVLWLIFLNLCVHTPRLTAFQRNIKIGNRSVLNWCREKHPVLTINHNNTLVQNLCQGCVIIDVISSLVKVNYDADALTHVTNCLEAVQREFGISKQILNPEQILSCKIEEEILLIYLALLKRKVKEKESKQLASTSNIPVTRPPPAVKPVTLSSKLAWTI